MRVGETYKIESDSMNVTLSERYIPKESRTGEEPKEYWRPLGYFRTYGQALNYLVKNEVRKVPHELQAIVDLENRLTSLISGLAIYDADRRSVLEVAVSNGDIDAENCE